MWKRFARHSRKLLKEGYFILLCLALILAGLMYVFAVVFQEEATGHNMLGRSTDFSWNISTPKISQRNSKKITHKGKKENEEKQQT